MTTLWERRISHVDRRVGPLEYRSLRGRALKAAVKKRRGQPSRNLPLGLVFELLRVKRANREGAPPDLGSTAKLTWRLLRERLLERKRTACDRARMRGNRSADETKIYLWRRRLQWLRAAEAQAGLASSTE